MESLVDFLNFMNQVLDNFFRLSIHIIFVFKVNILQLLLLSLLFVKLFDSFCDELKSGEELIVVDDLVDHINCRVVIVSFFLRLK